VIGMSNTTTRKLPDGCRRFRGPDGRVRIARQYSDSYAGSGWYGGVDERTFWMGYDGAVRDGRDPIDKGAFYCGARFFFGDDVALLLGEVERNGDDNVR
jgi:hypothetical protein